MKKRKHENQRRISADVSRIMSNAHVHPAVLYTTINQDINICNINPPSHTCEVVAHKQFMLLPASIWTTIHPCPYKQTRPSLAAGHRLGNCGLGRSCALVWKCSIVRVLQGPRILQHFTMWPIQPWFEF